MAFALHYRRCFSSFWDALYHCSVLVLPSFQLALTKNLEVFFYMQVVTRRILEFAIYAWAQRFLAHILGQKVFGNDAFLHNFIL